jgi:hypothetical protein
MTMHGHACLRVHRSGKCSVGNVFVLRSEWLQVALDNNQPEAAFDIFRKGGYKMEALNVLVERVQDMDRAHECAPACSPVVA